MEISFSDIMAADEVMHKISQMTPKEAFKFGYKYAQREVDKWLVGCRDCMYRSHEDGEWHSCLLHGGIKLPESHFCSDGYRRE